MEVQQIDDFPRHADLATAPKMQPPSDDLIVSLWPMYSRICLLRKKMVVYAADPINLKKFVFDRDTLTFVEYFCLCDNCKLIPHLNQLETAGTRGMLFEETHQDENKNRLLCISINWEDEYHGKMDIFVRADGCIGKYAWNEETGCFNLVQQFDVAMERQARVQIDAALPTGKELALNCYCNCLVFTSLVRSSKPEFRDRKYVFNDRRNQLDRVNCSCAGCEPMSGNPTRYLFPLSTDMIPILTWEIRDLTDKTSEELEKLWKAEIDYLEDHDKFWMCGAEGLWTLLNDPGFRVSVFLLVDRKGNIGPYTLDVASGTAEKFEKQKDEEEKDSEMSLAHEKFLSQKEDLEALGLSMKEDSYNEDSGDDEDANSEYSGHHDSVHTPDDLMNVGEHILSLASSDDSF